MKHFTVLAPAGVMPTRQSDTHVMCVSSNGKSVSVLARGHCQSLELINIGEGYDVVSVSMWTGLEIR